jgi:glycine cleavage system H protein
MDFAIPDDRRYTDSHEWAVREDEGVRIGITDFAQDELGDVVFVELPEVGETVEAGTAFGLVESIKAVSDVYAPVDGEVVAVNEALDTAPELVNDEPYGDGWMVVIETADDLDELRSPAAYEAEIA